ncbi:MAG TPA: universal stress protein [Candidatus Methylacidiphilales bacterium]
MKSDVVIRPGGAALCLDPKTITVFLDASPSGQKRAEHAVALAKRWDAYLVGVHIVFAGVTLPPSLCYARGHAGIAHAIAFERHLDAVAEAAATQVGDHFRSLCATRNVRGEFRPIGRAKTAEEAVINALQSDLVVIGHPEPNGLPDDILPERLLLTSSVPILIVPNAWEGETIGDMVLIGWNGTRQARRAVADSMTFLVAAKSVTVLVIDSAERRRRSEESGADIALRLARHGVQVDVEQVTSQGASIAQVILRHAEQSASDLLVVGAYSHTRLRRLLLGGVTRALLAQMPVPVLISR